MSDFEKAMRAQSKKPWVRKAELGEKSEGVRDALNAGGGDAVAGAKKLHYAKSGLAAAENKAVRHRKGRRP